MPIKYNYLLIKYWVFVSIVRGAIIIRILEIDDEWFHIISGDFSFIVLLQLLCMRHTILPCFKEILATPSWVRLSTLELLKELILSNVQFELSPHYFDWIVMSLIRGETYHLTQLVRNCINLMDFFPWIESWKEFLSFLGKSVTNVPWEPKDCLLLGIAAWCTISWTEWMITWQCSDTVTLAHVNLQNTSIN